MLKKLTKNQKNIEELIALYDAGSFAQVINLGLNLLERNPKSSQLHKIIGSSYFLIGDIDKALKHYKKTISLNPNCPISLNNLGVIFDHIGENDKAINLISKALTISPKYSDALNNLGNAQLNKYLFNQAINNFKKSLKINPYNAETYNNLGLAFQNKMMNEEAIINFKKAIAVKPNFIDAIFNLGNISNELDMNTDAKHYFNHIIKIQPNFAEAYNNLGMILFSEGKIDQAIENFKTAIRFKPKFHQAYFNLGNTLGKKDLLKAALENYNQSLEINPFFKEAMLNFKSTLKDLIFSDIPMGLDHNLKSAILIIVKYLLSVSSNSRNLLEKGYEVQKKISKLNFKTNKNQKNIISIVPSIDWEIITNEISSLLKERNTFNPVSINRELVKILHVDPIFQKFTEEGLFVEKSTDLLNKIIKISKNNLFLEMMNISPIPSIKIENFLTKIRREILEVIYKIDNEILSFQNALAFQCYINEFVYYESPSETKQINRLEIYIEEMIKDGKLPDQKLLLCLASYRSLFSYHWKSFINTKGFLEKIMYVQIKENNEEQDIKQKIKNLFNINNKVSKKVQNQYQDNPYPRWLYMNLSIPPKSIFEFLKDKKINVFDHSIFEISKPKVLIAGCGTGRQAIAASRRYKDCDVFAVDLSSSSLAYAQRKTKELGIKNIKYVQADILELKNLNMKFDIIECTGVLHHMNNPELGMKTINSCLKKNGLMRIGLYSKYARKHIYDLRKMLQTNYEKIDDENIRKMRMELINNCSKLHKQILESTDDFYSTSMFRDLILHVKEHQFTIPKIKKLLMKLSLNFCGFELREKVKENFLKHQNKKIDIYNLSKWDLFEKRNYDSFAGMYIFWCQKK